MARSYLAWARRSRLGRFRRVAGLAVIAVLAMLMLSGCSFVKGLFGGKQPEQSVSVSVFQVGVGDCFLAPAEVKAELATLSRVPCSQPHQQEAYAKEPFKPPGGSDAYPGGASLDTFAQGACAEAFSGYVGIDYPDSSLYFTYLLPSARSWQQNDDRSVLCFITTTGQSMTKSAKMSKM